MTPVRVRDVARIVSITLDGAHLQTPLADMIIPVRTMTRVSRVLLIRPVRRIRRLVIDSLH